MPQKKSADCSCQILECRKLSFFEHAEYNVISLLDLVQKKWNLRRMVLHVIIHSNDQISLRMIHSRHDRIVLSEILGKVDSLDIRMFLCQCMDCIPRSIPGIIVDQHKFTLVVFQFLKFFYSQFYHFADGMF